MNGLPPAIRKLNPMVAKARGTNHREVDRGQRPHGRMNRTGHFTGQARDSAVTAHEVAAIEMNWSLP